MILQHDNNFGADFVDLTDEGGELVAKVIYRGDGTQQENAERIVAAFNSHDQLVEALRHAKRQLNNANRHIDCDEEIALVDAALTAAGAA